ncbi:hypothetical protein [Roseburia sp. OM04-10AA]|uniref:hypothetical protein n=1 Tax=Roseburia sp. OM04-10AA TaxID=2293141 RepID=UPI0011C3A28B|nr:hypothetical protein [Roseburia sp. OM04-10AA]
MAAVIIVWSSIFGLYKSEEKQTGVTWIVMLLILLNCYHTFWAAVLDLVHIPINIISIGIIDMITGGIVWFFNWKKKKYQKYEFAVSDLMFVVTAVVVLIILQNRDMVEQLLILISLQLIQRIISGQQWTL